MMFLNCQKPGLIKDPYIYRPDSIMLDLEDAVAENQKDAARYSLYHALQEIDYRGVERVVRINGLDTPHWKEDIRVCVAGGADTIRIAKTESAQDVHTVEEHVLAAEREFGRPEGSTLLMAALESCKGVLNALEVCKSSDRLIGIALSGGDYTKDLQTVITGTGVELHGRKTADDHRRKSSRCTVLGYRIHQPGCHGCVRGRGQDDQDDGLRWQIPRKPAVRSMLFIRSSPRPRRKSSSQRRL